MPVYGTRHITFFIIWQTCGMSVDPPTNTTASRSLGFIFAVSRTSCIVSEVRSNISAVSWSNFSRVTGTVIVLPL
jgi:hypothetical protein